MTTKHTRMPSRTRRRFSSSAAANRSPGSPKTAPIFKRRLPRRVSLSPPNTADPSRHDLLRQQRNHWTDGSEYEDDENTDPFDFERPTSRSRSPKSLLFSRQRLPDTYSSLPPTPLIPGESYSPRTPISPLAHDFVPPKQEQRKVEAPFSLWEYLREELLATDFDSHQEEKWERVSNFLSMPLAMEKVTTSTRLARNYG